MNISKIIQMKKDHIKHYISTVKDKDVLTLEALKENQKINNQRVQNNQMAKQLQQQEEEEFKQMRKDKIKRLFGNLKIKGKKAQGGPVMVIFLLIVFLLNWALWLGGWLSEAGTMAISNGQLTGVEAFFYANLNLWVGLSLLLGSMAYFYLSGGS